MSDTFEQKIRLAALEDKGKDVALVKVSDLVALLNRTEISETEASRLYEKTIEWEDKFNGLAAQALQEKPCKCGKYIDLRT